FARSYSQGDQTASNFGFAGREIGHADVSNALVIACAAPHRSAIHATRCDLLFPKDLSFLVGIAAVHHARLVTRYEHPLARTKRAKHSGVAEIRIDEGVSRAVRFILPDTREVIAIALGELPSPQRAAGIHVERQDGIAGVGWRVRVVHSSSGVKDSFLK